MVEFRLLIDSTKIYYCWQHQFKGKLALEIQKSALEKEAGNEIPAPQGIGMAVAFDWGLAVQIAFTPILSLIARQSNMLKVPGLNPVVSSILIVIIAIAVACIPALFGEMIRSGRNWARNIQLGANILLTIAGLVGLINLYQSIKVGNYWPLVTEIILLIFSPLIVWRLSRPVTAQWFKAVTPAQAHKRHGGTWVFFIILWSLAGGILQILATMSR